MLDLLAGFIQELRKAGLPVSLTENLDAMEAVKHIPIEDREAFKYALAATLVKANAHWKTFETVFEVYFSLRGAEYKIGDLDEDEAALAAAVNDMLGQPSDGGGGLEGLTAEELAELFDDAYAGEPFVELRDGPVGVLDVRDTNFCRISWHSDPRTGRAIVFAAIDNLWKGAASQAVQNLNLMFERPETEGLL